VCVCVCFFSRSKTPVEILTTSCGIVVGRRSGQHEYNVVVGGGNATITKCTAERVRRDTTAFSKNVRRLVFSPRQPAAVHLVVFLPPLLPHRSYKILSAQTKPKFMLTNLYIYIYVSIRILRNNGYVIKTYLYSNNNAPCFRLSSPRVHVYRLLRIVYGRSSRARVFLTYSAAQ